VRALLWEDTYTGTCVSIYIHSFTHSPFNAGVDVGCVAQVSDTSMIDVTKIGCFWCVERRLEYRQDATIFRTSKI